MKTAKTQNRGRHGRRDGLRRRPGFTLVEIMAAMSLAVIILLGVVQVFKMATDSVSQAEAKSDSYQMAHGVFSIMQKDLWAMAREGYIFIQPAMMLNPELTRDNTGDYFTKSASGTSTTAWYDYDCLYFTAVGRFREMGTGTTNPEESAAAEIFYGPALRSSSKQTPWQGSMHDADARAVCLIRKAFLCESNMGSSSIKINSLPDASRHNFIMMQRENIFDASPKYRLAPLTVAGTYGYDNVNSQVVDVKESDGFEPNVNYVIADRISQFIVEVWAWDGDEFTWKRATTNSGSGNTSKITYKASVTPCSFGGATSSTDGPMEKRYLWCGYRSNPKYAQQRFSPQMIRVTVVIHPHSDQVPIYDQPYGGNVFRGEVFRQVFRLTGVRGGLRDIPTTYYTKP